MKFKVSNKSWILLSTTILIGIAFSVYFLVYVKGKEKEIISNNFRVLQQIVLNIESLKESYQRNAETYYNNLDTAWTTQDDTKINELNTNLEPLDEIDSGYLKDDHEIIFGKDGLIFKVKGSGRSDAPIFFQSDYDVFFNNQLFYRSDIFDQIIISRINPRDSSNSRVLFSNSIIGVLDSAFFQKTIYSAKNEVTITDKNYITFNQKIDDDFQIYISGLVEASKFNRQKRSVSPYIIFILSVLLILIVLAMPILKLQIMSIYERLYLSDVSFSIISVLVGPAIFIVFMYAVFIYFGFERNTIEERLETLSGKIEDNMRLELMDIVHQINRINNNFSDVTKKSIRQDNVFLANGISKLKTAFKQTARSKELNSDTVDWAVELMSDYFDLKKLKYNKVTKGDYPIQGYRVFESVILSDSIDYKHLKAAFWADDSAQLMILLSGFHQPSYVQDLSHRYYLTNILNKTPDLFYDTSGIMHEIAIESIKSVNDGSYEVGIGMATGELDENEDLPVFAIATKMASVMNPVLEEGFGFCILDKTGKTLFHSDITKNMNENFINETDEIFGHSIRSQREICRITNYNGIDQTIYLRPLECLSGTFIATFVRDETHFGVFTLSMASSFLLFFMFLIYIFLVYMVLYLSVNKTTKLKQMSYLFNFFRPYETKNMEKIYLRLVGVFFLGIIYLIFTMWISSEYFDFLIGELLVITTILLVFSFQAIVRQLHKDQLLRYVIRVPKAANSRILAVLVILFVLVRFIMILIKYDVHVILNNLVGIGVIFLILRELVLNKHFIDFSPLFTSKDRNKKTQQIYKVYLLFWVILLSIIPIHIFLDITIKSEQSIFKKYNAHQLTMRLNEWEEQTKSEFSDKFEKSEDFDVFLNSMKRKGLNRAVEYRLDSNNTEYLNNSKLKAYQHSIFDRLYGRIRPKYNDRVAATNNYIASSASDSSWYSKNTSDSLYFILNSKFSDPDFDMIVLERGEISNRIFPMVVFNNGVSVIILVVFLGFIINRVYGFGYKHFARNVEPVNCDSQIKKYLNKDLFTNSSAYNNIFFVGVNTAHFSYIKSFLQDENRKFYDLDFYDFNELQLGNSNKEFEAFEKLVSLGRFQKEWEEIKKHFDNESEQIYILVEHFEYGYNDIEMNKLKLEVLKYLIDCENFKVIIKSEINPTKLLEYYESSIKRIEEPIKKASANERVVLQEKLDKLKVDYKKWQHLLGCFIKVIVPINIFYENDTICGQGDDEQLISEALKQEVNHGEYLNMVKRYMDKSSSNTLSNEDQVLMVQQMSYPYYFSVWNSLSKEERYLVYDIAKDKYVNTTNTNAILSLLSKGILIYDHSLRLMNDSFTNFVLTKVSSDEALEMELISRKKGTWNTAFAVILLLIISLVIFLSIGQQNFLNDLNAFLTAIVALVGLLIRFSGVVSLGSAKMADSS